MSNSRISRGRILRRSDLSSLSTGAGPPARWYSSMRFSNSATPSSTLSKVLMGFVCSSFTSRRRVSSRMGLPWSTCRAMMRQASIPLSIVARLNIVSAVP